MMQFKKVLSPFALSSALSSAIALAGTAQAGEVEVLHWWTSGGEAAAANVLKDLLKKEGHTWEDFAVAGGGGESAMTVLKSRAVSGNPPAAAQIKGLDIQEWAQHAMARLIMEPKFQTAFNVNKGSIPVRSDVDREPFDRCATDSMDTFAESSQSGKLVPSMAHGLATTSYVQGAIFDVVTNFFNTPSITAEEAVNKLAQAVKAAG